LINITSQVLDRPVAAYPHLNLQKEKAPKGLYVGARDRNRTGTGS
jgi:hypothetical protein